MKKIISLLLVLLLALTRAVAVNAEGIKDIFGSVGARGTVVATGKCGKNLTYELNGEGVLTISGTGTMYTYYEWSGINKGDITSVVIGDGVTSIGTQDFYGFSSLRTVSISTSSNLTSICSRAFNGCSSLTSITIPSNVTSIESYAFNNCSSLGTVSISTPSILTSIGDHAFQSCSSLTSITIPSSVTSIGDFAFQNCSSLASVAILNKNASLGSNVFSSPNNSNGNYGKIDVCGYPGSAFESYCDEYNYLDFVPISDHNVTFNANGGTFEGGLTSLPPLKKTFSIDITTPIPPVASDANHVFAGWSLSNDNDYSEWIAGRTYKREAAEDTDVYAIWLPRILDPLNDGTSYTGNNDPVPGYSDSRNGNMNGDSQTWIKQSARWTNSSSGVAELRVDYSFDADTIYQARDVVFVLDVSGSMSDYNNIDTMKNVVASMTATILNEYNDCRIAYTAFSTGLDGSLDFTSSAYDALSFVASLHVAGGTNYSAGLDKAYDFISGRTDTSRDPMLIFFTDGAPNDDTPQDDNGIHGGTEATDIKNLDCPISSVYLGTLSANGRTQLNGISSSPSMVYNALDGSTLGTCMKNAFVTVAERDYEMVINLDTNRFETSATTANVYNGSGTNLGSTTVSISSNVITWDVSSLTAATEYYFTIPLELVVGPVSGEPNRGATYTYPTSLEGSSIATVKNNETSAVVNTVDTPVLTLNDDTNSIRYLDGGVPLKIEEITNTSATYVLSASPLSSGAEQGIAYDIANGIPEKNGFIFAGWYTSQAAADACTVADAYPTTFTISNYLNQSTGNVDLYAGWVAKGTVTVDNSDPNKGKYGANTLSGFNLEGIQIKSKDIADVGEESEGWQEADHDGLRFLTVYRNGMLTELDNLYKTGNPNYGTITDAPITYGYTVYAMDDLDGISTLNADVNGAKDVNCTRDGDMNHKMFTDYRLSTFVVRYDATSQTLQDDLATKIEARAYVNYIDANGFARRSYNTYIRPNGTQFAGGCRASFNDALAALKRQ